MNKVKIISSIISVSLIFQYCGGSGGGSQTTPSSSPDTYSKEIFGVNMPWENLSDGCFTEGELIRDRSFRINSTGLTDTLGNAADTVWKEYVNGGTISYSSTGGDTPSGEKSYQGYSEITRTSSGTTGIFQTLTEGVKNAETYRLTISSFGTGQIETFGAYIYDTSAPGSPISVSSPLYSASGNNTWDRQSIDLTVSSDAASAGIFIYFVYSGSGTHSIRFDEIRLSKLSAVPRIKSSVKTSLTSMGAKSIRWPGGTLVDFFDWKNSIGSVAARGENRASASYGTVSFGLHEFLNLCEEMNITPVLQVNYLNGGTEASELVEYVLGNESTTQGVIRKANGRTNPWNVIYFEVGNEPSAGYKGAGLLTDTPATYAAAVKPVIAAMRSKASSLGRNIKVSGIIEPGMQLTTWLGILAADPNPIYDILRVLYNWNADVLGVSGFGDVDFLDGHFYGYKEYDSAMSEADAFTYVMAGGAVLEKTLKDKITPLSTLPVWITEFHIFPEDKTTKVPQTAMMMDFRSGLAIADIMFSLIKNNVEGAHIWNLAQPWFGSIQNPDMGRLRPTGLAFKLISAIGGEEKTNVYIDNNDSITTTQELSNVPLGLNYKLVSAIASKNSATGKPRILLLNRSYSQSKTVHLTFDSAVSGNADIFTLNNASLSANNESSENVTITSSTGSFTYPLEVTIPAHSLIRIDMN